MHGTKILGIKVQLEYVSQNIVTTSSFFWVVLFPLTTLIIRLLLLLLLLETEPNNELNNQVHQN